MRNLISFLLHNPHYLLPFFVAQIGDGFNDGGGLFDGLISAIIAEIQAALIFLFNLIVFIANYIFAVLNFLYQFLVTLFRDIANAFKWLWDSVVKSILTKAVALFLRVRNFLQRVLNPIISYALKIRAFLDKYFNQFVKPVLNVIRQLRQVLQIFRLLGFKWAARLDARLAQIENKIVAAYQLLRTNLNQVISFVQLIADPLGILRRNPLFASLIRSAPELQNILLQATQRPLTGSEAATQKADVLRATPQAQKANFDNYYSQGKLPPDMVQARSNFSSELSALQSGADVGNQ